MFRFAATAAAIFAASFAVASAADEWGDLTLRLVYDGEPPKPRELPVDKDRAVCKDAQIDESLLVNAKDRGVASVVIWLVQGEADPALPIHPSYEQSAKAEVPLGVKDCRYDPHVVLARSSQMLVLKNLDPIGHTFQCQLALNRSFSFTGIPGRDLSVTFDRAETTPAQVVCAIHPWMIAWLLVRDNPYMAASDASGNLKISNLPTGKRKFVVWHERRGFVRQVTRDGENVALPAEGLLLEIKPGANDLGQWRLKPEAFERNK